MSSSLVKFYDTYHKQNARNIKLISRNNITYWHIIRLIEKAEKHLPGKKVLDVGCGVGSLSFYLSHKGAIVLAIDVSERAIQLAKYTQIQTKSSSIKFVRAGLSEMSDQKYSKNMSPSTMDMIVCTEVIEHIDDDSEMLADCYRMLKSNGKLVITTQRNDGWLFKNGYFAEHDRRVGHLRRYDPNTLVNLIEANGFKISFKQDADGLLRSILYTTKLGWLLKLIRGPLVPLFQWLDKETIKVFGAADIQIIAIKK